MDFIKLDNVSYAYPVYSEEAEPASKIPLDKTCDWALENVSLSVREGEFVCVLGKNGSGKSTLARLLNALLVPNEGTVFVDGIESKDGETAWEIRKNVGMVFQNPDNQIVAQVVEEDVAFGLENLGVQPVEIRRKVKESLENLGMASYAKSSPLSLSGGQKQRVAVAGILAMEPKCIVFDEATSMLDPKGREEVLEMASKLNKEKGITIISITHYMDEAEKADRIVVMEKGRIVLEGTPKEIFVQKEKIEQAGLRLPQVAELAYRLRECGLDVPLDVVFEDELFNWLKNRT